MTMWWKNISLFLCALTHPSYARSYFCMRQFYLVLPFKWTTEKKLQTPTLPSAIYAWKRRGFHTRLASFFFFFLNLPLYNLILLLTVSHNCRRLNWYLAIYFFCLLSLPFSRLIFALNFASSHFLSTEERKCGKRMWSLSILFKFRCL